jgi:ABC-2 type transport system permease protein
LISPFLMGIGMIDEIGLNIKTENIVWSQAAIGILLAELAVIVLVIVITSWIHRHKTTFL